MDDFLKDDTFLARWLADELTGQELNKFQQHPDFSRYQQLVKASSNLNIPELDEAALFQKIKMQHQNGKTIPTRQRKLSRRLFIPAAAILFLIIGYLALFRNQDSTFKTSFGEQVAHTLPDGSSVLLNANSEITYHLKDFKKNRNLVLHGEAFFEVKEGSSFKVQTKNGQVEVLGTSFSVYSRAQTMVTACKTGRVRVKDNAQNQVSLTPGERVRNSHKLMQEKETVAANVIGGWKSGRSEFDSEHLSLVTKAIENQFGVSIQLDQKQGKEKFTGSFLHKDLETALQMVYVPMGLNFEEKEKGVIVIK